MARSRSRAAAAGHKDRDDARPSCWVADASAGDSGIDIVPDSCNWVNARVI